MVGSSDEEIEREDIPPGAVSSDDVSDSGETHRNFSKARYEADKSPASSDAESVEEQTQQQNTADSKQLKTRNVLFVTLWPLKM